MAMAYFAGNFFNGTAIKIQCRLFLISWLKRDSGKICCANERCYSSSPLVGHIPTKAVKNEENGGISLTARYMEEKRIGPELSVGSFGSSNESSRSFLDVNSESDDECLPSGVNRGLNLAAEEESEVDEFIESASPSGHSWQDVQNSAVELLASRAFTAMELKKKLQGKKFQHETIDAVIIDFQSRGLINDCLYAEAYTRSRWSSSSWGPRRIRQALFKKGVSEADAENAIKLVFENSEGDEDQDSGISMSKLSIDQLYLQASKQWQRSHGASQEIRKSRIVRWLQYRGFNWGVIKYVLKKLESGSPP
ncbi:hypothetical protein C2S52_005802 [Perilla frutescens var. hirtella]|nr:hypothetical protein C2S52_005802 [Perilla frutescens var. hirtella]